LAPIELRDQCEPAVLSSVEVTGELGDLGFELIQRADGCERGVPIHGATPRDIAMPLILQHFN
jgi:hypothetical protein